MKTDVIEYRLGIIYLAREIKINQQFPLNPFYPGMRCPCRGCLSLGYPLSPHSGVSLHLLAGIAEN